METEVNVVPSTADTVSCENESGAEDIIPENEVDIDSKPLTSYLDDQNENSPLMECPTVRGKSEGVRMEGEDVMKADDDTDDFSTRLLSDDRGQCEECPDDLHQSQSETSKSMSSHRTQAEDGLGPLPSSETTETFIDDGCSDVNGIVSDGNNVANVKINGSATSNGQATVLQNSEKSLKNLDDLLVELKFGWFQVKMLILTGGAYFAVCAQIMCLVFLSTPIKKEWKLSKYSFSWLPFSTGVSGILGGYIVGTLSDRFGRQKPFLVSMVLCTVFGFASPAANSFGLLITLRAFVSMTIGGLSAVNFVLLLEVLPRTNRGCYMVVITLCGALGAVLAGGLAWLLLEQYGWRIFLASCSVPSLFVVLLRLYINYESPRYLLISNQPDKALSVLRVISRNNRTTIPKDLTEIHIDCQRSEERGRIQQLFTKDHRRKTIFASFVWILQSMGFWGVTIYMPEYMMKQGVDPYFSMFTIFIGEIPGLLLAMILIERHMFGRLRCLRFFSLFTCISLIAFAVVNLDFLRAVFAVVCYFFMVPVYSILNTLTPEIYPTSVRSTAMAWMNIIIEIPSLVTPFVGETLLSSHITWLYPIVWATCFFLQLIFSFGLKTETAGRNLDESSAKSNPKSDVSESSESNSPIKAGMIGCDVKLQLAHSTVSDNSDSMGCEFF